MSFAETTVAGKTEQSFLTTEIEPTTETEKEVESILVILQNLNLSYLMTENGMSTPVNISVPESAAIEDYTYLSQSAIVKDKLHIFGGKVERRRIARLDNCEFVELSVRLNFKARDGHAALSIFGGQKALICFEMTDSIGTSCDIFNGTEVARTFSTSFPHLRGGLGLYNGQPTTVGNQQELSTYGRTETLTSEGWSLLLSHPKATDSHHLVGLESGDMLMFGGIIRQSFRDEAGDSILSDVWRLRNNKWIFDGYLQKPVSFGTAIRIEESIFIFAGKRNYEQQEYPVEKVDLIEDEELRAGNLLGNNEATFIFPILYQVDKDRCVTN